MNYNQPNKKNINILDETDNPNTFIIYTTGLSNGLNALYNNSSEQNIAKIYNELKLNLFGQIPDKFKIIIRHYDPISIDSYNCDDLKIKKLRENISYLKAVSKDDKNHPSVISSKFIQSKLPLDKINIMYPHIILDFAHIFTYTNNPETLIHGKYYNESKQTICRDFNVLRFGFLGNNISKAIFASDKLFNVDNDGNVLTLTTNMRQRLSFLLDNIYHEDPVEKLFTELIRDGIKEDISLGLQKINSIKYKLENKLTARGIGLFDAQDIIIEKIKNIEFVKIITNKIIESIWDNTLILDIKCNKGRIIINNIIDLIVDKIIL
jgi:hypothetical protein